MLFISIYVSDIALILKVIFFVQGLPCVFCLLMNKKAMSYRHILGELRQIALNRGKTFSPIMVMSDFESGILPVVKSEVGCTH